MKRVLAIILGGGKGSRLYPLTKMRAKPAVPLAGKYRLIDIPISNCINSGIEKIKQKENININKILKNLYETNFFENVSVSLDGKNLKIDVVEFPIIEKIEFEGVKAKKKMTFHKFYF